MASSSFSCLPSLEPTCLSIKRLPRFVVLNLSVLQRHMLHCIGMNQSLLFLDVCPLHVTLQLYFVILQGSTSSLRKLHIDMTTTQRD